MTKPPTRSVDGPTHKAMREATRPTSDLSERLIEVTQRARAAQKAVDATTISRHVDVWMTQDEYDAMTLMCGYATGAAMKQNDKKLARAFMLVTNRLHEANLHWRPLEVEPEGK